MVNRDSRMTGYRIVVSSSKCKCKLSQCMDGWVEGRGYALSDTLYTAGMDI